ncbi:hypothetical protein SBRY_70245 [Actinacidiphila bryophytorum]|uniref:Uncharacterized protein n=1 Tax=Actinacidiphila bryophytorum TaxID=1436133 RepID=A0A9W4MH83_9ACTN|nr:hypothetical protein SBRY_70245 [Actinacidiphila bryophytorum]
MVHAGQLDPGLDQRRVEHGVLGCPGRSGAGLPEPGLHDAEHHAGVAREAVHVPGQQRQLRGVRAEPAHQRQWCVLAQHPGHVHPAEPVLRGEAGRERGDHQRGAGPGPQPGLHPRHLPRGRADQRDPRQHRGAGPGLRHDRAGQRRRRDEGLGRRRRPAGRLPDRRGCGQLPAAAAGGRPGFDREPRGQPDHRPGRLRPCRRCTCRAGADRVRDQQQRRDHRPHLDLAGRPRQRTDRLDGQPGRHRPEGQRQQRAGHRPVRGALQEVRRGVARPGRQDDLLPEREGLRRPEPGGGAERQHPGLRRVQGGRQRHHPRGLGPGQLLQLHRGPVDHPGPRVRGADHGGGQVPRPPGGLARRHGPIRPCHQQHRSGDVRHRHDALDGDVVPVTGGPGH